MLREAIVHQNLQFLALLLHAGLVAQQVGSCVQTACTEAIRLKAKLCMIDLLARRLTPCALVRTALVALRKVDRTGTALLLVAHFAKSLNGC